MSTSPKGKVCPKVHRAVCQVCGKEYVIECQSVTPRLTCSEECRYKLAGNTYLQNADIHLAKTRDTMLKRYGQANPFKIPEFKEKARQTCLARYGADRFVKSKYFIDAAKQTNQKRYGKDWYMQTTEYHDSVVKTCLEKYGTTNPSQSRECLADRMTDPTKLESLLKFRENPGQFIQNNFKESPTLREISDICGIRDSSVAYILQDKGLSHLVKFDYSRMETEIFEFLSQYIPSESIVRNTFQVITPYELDLYIPEYSFAIECNPTWTHNSTRGIYSGSPVPVGYHKMKTDMCESQGIRLYHLFGYDWTHHKETCKSMLLNAVGKTPTRYYARKLTLREVGDSEAYQFLQDNHRQGGVHSKIRLGLYHNDILVSLMTFSKLRHTIGTGSDTAEDCWELVRFCNLNYTNVVGGASKLLKHFIQMYCPREIRSFSDRAHTSGNLYPQLGFTNLRQSEPGYVWVDLKTDRAYARFNAQKRNIRRFLQDDTIDLSQTEVQIMSEHGFVQVYDSGTITWQLIPTYSKEVT